MKVLVACEESGEVTTRFLKAGHDAWSCDLLPTSGTRRDRHLQQDVVPLLEQNWDLVIAFPPCTHLATSGARWFEKKIKDGRQQQGIDFFMLFTNLPHIPKVAIENPIGIMSSKYRKPDQIIQPYYFGDPYTKSTCLWLKGLEYLRPTKIVNKGFHYKGYQDWCSLPPSNNRSRLRSKTFPGIANAMVSQWGKICT